MRKLLVISSILLNGIIQAQEINYDSLRNIISNTSDSTKLVREFLVLSNAYLDSKYDSTWIYAQRALDISKRLNLKNEEASSLNIMASIHWFLGNFDDALATYIDAMKLWETEYHDPRNLEAAYGIAKCYTNIGMIYADVEKPENALINEKKAIALYRSIVHKLGIESSNKLNINEVKRNLTNVLMNYGHAFELVSQYDSALFYQNEANSIAASLGNKNLQGETLLNIGAIYFYKKDPSLSLKYYRNSKKYLEPYQDFRSLSIANHGIAEVMNSENILDSGIYYARSAHEYAIMGELTEEQYNADTMLSRLFEKRGIYDSALKYRKSAAIAYEDMQVTKQKLDVQGLRFKEEARQQEIKTQLASAKKEQKLKTRNLLIIILIPVSAILLIGAIKIFRDFKKENKSKKRIEMLQRELHHRVRNNLAVISRLIEVAAKEAGNNLPLKELENQVSSIGFVHDQLTNQEDVTQLEMNGFLQKLTEHINLSMSSKMPVHFDLDANLALFANKATPLALIANELATNSIKYAFPTENKKNISIRMTKSNGLLNFHYWDNGKGRPIESAPGYGTKLIKGLSSQLGGKTREWNSDGYNFELIFPNS